MLKFQIKTTDGSIQLNLPTNVSEITPEYLEQVTKSVNVADNYSLIAIVYKESLASVILASNRKQKSINSRIIPVFVKHGKCNTTYIHDIDCGDKIIISPSDISLGHHIDCPNNKISVNNVLDLCSLDKEAYTNAIKVSQPCCYVEFKLVPNSSIHGHYNESDDTEFNNPYIVVNKD